MLINLIENGVQAWKSLYFEGPRLWERQIKTDHFNS